MSSIPQNYSARLQATAPITSAPYPRIGSTAPGTTQVAQSDLLRQHLFEQQLTQPQPLETILQSFPREGGTLEQLMWLATNIGKFEQSFATQRQADSQAGVGFLQSAQNVGRQARDFYTNHRRAAIERFQASAPNEFEQVGQQLLQSQQNSLLQQAGTWAGNKLGLNLSSSFSGVADDAASSLLGTSQTAVGSALSSAASVLSGVGAAYGVYTIGDTWGQIDPVTGTVQGAATGAAIGSLIVPGLGTAVGAGVGAVIGAIGGFVKTGKHGDQVRRDQVRDAMIEIGMIDEQWQLTLADGSTFDVGKDGGARLENLDGTDRAYYQVDFGHPLADQAIGLTQGLAAVLTGGDEKLGTDFTGYFTNAVLSNATTLDEVKANAYAIFRSMGLSPEAVMQTFGQLGQSGKVEAARVAAYANGFQEIFRRSDVA